MSSLPKRPLWGVFGGSFDPPHIGHVALVRDLIAKIPLKGISVVPSWNHPFNQHKAVAPYDERLSMAQLAFADFDNISVSDIEKRLSLSGYTFDTLLALKQEQPTNSLAFIVGADLLSQFWSWHRPEEILREAILIVGQRPGHSLTIPPDIPSESICVVETPLIDVSSSAIRAMIRKSGIAPIERLVPPQVSTYIAEHRLYL